LADSHSAAWPTEVAFEYCIVGSFILPDVLRTIGRPPPLAARENGRLERV
jgi:hypothetical protein